MAICTKSKDFAFTRGGTMNPIEKLGYLDDDFKIFHIVDKKRKIFDFHYHDFNKITIFLSGNINYSIEGKNYTLKPYDIILCERR